MSSQGSFVPQPQHDILVETIRTKEHDGGVSHVGEDIGLRLWFGTQRKSTHMQKKEKYKIVEKKLASERKRQKKELEDLDALYNKKL